MIEITRSLLCNWCQETVNALDRVDITRAQLETRARELGWQVGRRHKCPTCVAEGRR